MWRATLLILTLFSALLGLALFSHPLPNDDDAGDYLINTTQCLLKRYPLFDVDTTRAFKRFPNLDAGYPSCYRRPTGIERVNFTWIRIPQRLLDKGCTAIQIERDSTNDGVKYGQRMNNLNSTLTELPYWDAALVECGGWEKAVVALIPDKAPFNYSDIPKSVIHHNNPPNVLMIGIDAISRLNFKRHFIKTDAFLKNVGFQPFYGHHKVGSNSAPNMFPMMLGEHLSTSLAWLNRTSSDLLDPLPFIQKYYSNAGYLTSYNEDMVRYGLFAFDLPQRMGHQLTEYYMRPANLELAKLVYSGYSMCYENRLETEYYYDYILDLLRAHQVRGHTHFTWIHMALVNHEELNLCQYLDLPLHRLLSTIFIESLQSNTIIMLYSDHEIRVVNSITYTESGFHETRLPVLYVYMPQHVQLLDEAGQWLNMEQLRQSLAGNAHSLTSHMDIHATLRHILTGNPPPSPGSNLSDAEPYGKSLFTPISPERTCAQAGIPLELCLCVDFYSLENNEVAEQVAKRVVHHINQNILALPDFQDRCQQHEFSRVLQAKMIRGQADQPSDLLLLMFATGNGAEFGVNIKLPKIEDSHTAEAGTVSSEIVGEIARIDRYVVKSFCVRHLGRIERFCVCKKS